MFLARPTLLNRSQTLNNSTRIFVNLYLQFFTIWRPQNCAIQLINNTTFFSISNIKMMSRNRFYWVFSKDKYNWILEHDRYEWRHDDNVNDWAYRAIDCTVTSVKFLILQKALPNIFSERFDNEKDPSVHTKISFVHALNIINMIVEWFEQSNELFTHIRDIH